MARQFRVAGQILDENGWLRQLVFEEGFTVLQRLASGWVLKNAEGTRYHAFRSEAEADTIRALLLEKRIADNKNEDNSKVFDVAGLVLKEWGVGACYDGLLEEVLLNGQITPEDLTAFYQLSDVLKAFTSEGREIG